VEITKMAASFHIIIIMSVYSQFQQINSLWKHFAIALHEKIMKKNFFKMAQIFKMVALFSYHIPKFQEFWLIFF
jgi:hypothetical protein